MAYKPKVLALADGGTNANLTASNGGILYSTASAGAILAGTATASQILLSGASTTPSWSTATYPATAGSSGNVLTSNGTNFTSTAPATRVTTINGDTGSVTGATITLEAAAGGKAGSSVTFSGSGTTMVLNMTDSIDNIIIGRVAGNGTITGGKNIGIGAGVLNAASTAQQNVGIGYVALSSMTTSGTNNVGIGIQSLTSLLTGSYNTCIGQISGSGYTGSESSNILIGASGIAAESNVMRLGTSGSGNGQVSTCFVAGVTGVTVTGTAVLCSATGQFGTIASSERYKENIINIDESVSILHLRPVEFNYKSDHKKTKNYGLIAEEIEKDFPYLCFHDRENRPESVKYHELPIFLLNEIKKLHKRIEHLERLHQE